MNYVKEIFERCDINSITDYLMYGTESFENYAESYYEGLNETYKKLYKFLSEQFPEEKELDEQSSYIFSLTSNIKRIYMQIGLRAGIMLSIDFFNKNNGK